MIRIAVAPLVPPKGLTAVEVEKGRVTVMRRPACHISRPFGTDHRAAGGRPNAAGKPYAKGLATCPLVALAGAS